MSDSISDLRRRIIAAKNPALRVALTRQLTALTRDKRVEDLKVQIRSCRNCELGRIRKKAVPFSGPAFGRADLILVGEAPGANEDREGVPFVGRSGKFLNHLLETAGTHRDRCMVINALCCRPDQNRDPQDSEIEACRPNFHDQLALAQVRVGVTLGGYALSALMGWPRSIIKVRNQLEKFFWVDGRIWLSTYHPSYALRNTGTIENYWDAPSEEKPEIADEIVKSLRAALALSKGEMVPKIPWDRVEFNGVSGEKLGDALKKKKWALIDSKTFGCQIVVLKQEGVRLPRAVENVPRYTVDELWRLGEIGGNRGGWTRDELRSLHMLKTEFGGEIIL